MYKLIQVGPGFIDKTARADKIPKNVIHSSPYKLFFGIKIAKVQYFRQFFRKIEDIEFKSFVETLDKFFFLFLVEYNAPFALRNFFALRH